jgi:vacuolar-type H+-ATPase subunit I/STV1
MYITTDEELRTSISKLEIARAEDAVKCEAVINKIKKSAGIQINEANSRVQQLLEQLDELKAQKSELIGAERRTSQELEKLKIQFEVDKRKYEGANALMLNDVTMLKKELADYKARSQKLSALLISR